MLLYVHSITVNNHLESDITVTIFFQGLDGPPGDKGDDGEPGQPVS